jgi:nitrate/nitrite transporter NarK
VAGVGALALGIVQGPDWGWGSGGVLGAFGVAAALLPLVVFRSARHRAPVIELGLFRARSFAVANAGMVAFSTAFYALLLCNVLFLTGGWGYSILEAGFAVTPGPLMAALTAPLGGGLSDRFGQRLVALPGALLFAAGCALFASGVDATPDYVSEYLGPTILTGAGVGLSFASWSSAAVAELPPARFATGSAVLACLRQIGAVLGIAALVAVLEAAPPGVEGFTDAWTLMAITAGVVALLALALGRVRTVAPAVSSAEAPA